MISDTDRSFWFGASDTKYVIAKNYDTATFKKWWLEKLGLIRNDFSNKYTLAGSNYEHKILDALSVAGLEKDKQVRVEELLLRVNLDGSTDAEIYEVKTYKEGKRFNEKQYIPQVQVQMFATGMRTAYIIAYPLGEEDYKNFFNPIVTDKIIRKKIEYDQTFINERFLPDLGFLVKCLKSGNMPTNASKEEYMCQK